MGRSFLEGFFYLDYKHCVAVGLKILNIGRDIPYAPFRQLFLDVVVEVVRSYGKSRFTRIRMCLFFSGVLVNEVTVQQMIYVMRVEN